MRTAFAPGRVNLIGDHTDYTGGWALPMAIHLGTTVTCEVGADAMAGTDLVVASADFGTAVIGPGRTTERWARYVAAVAEEIDRRPRSARLTVQTTVPIGAGLSSSAALEVSVALALGFAGGPLELALLCQRAEQRASGVPSGLMDQLTSTSGVAGHALLMDCTSNTVEPVPVPPDVEIVAIHSGQPRALSDSAYAERRRDCEEAARIIGPLRDARIGDLDAITDPVVKRRARHVITENQRTRHAAAALTDGDADTVGRLMVESHRSLADDFDVSTPALDALVARLLGTAGVFGARLTGAGFGGCVVALTRPGAVRLDEFDTDGWRLEPSGPARVM